MEETIYTPYIDIKVKQKTGSILCDIDTAYEESMCCEHVLPIFKGFANDGTVGVNIGTNRFINGKKQFYSWRRIDPVALDGEAIRMALINIANRMIVDVEQRAKHGDVLEFRDITIRIISSKIAYSMAVEKDERSIHFTTRLVKED